MAVPISWQIHGILELVMQLSVKGRLQHCFAYSQQYPSVHEAMWSIHFQVSAITSEECCQKCLAQFRRKQFALYVMPVNF
jgi:hypothetical protein